MAADRDPTPGELRIMFENILEALRDVREAMATKEFVNAKFDAYNDRVARIESDVKDWITSSTAAHVKLDADAKLGNQQVNTRIDELEKEQKAQEQTIKAQRNGRAQALTIAVVGSILSVIGSVIASGIIRGLFPV